MQTGLIRTFLAGLVAACSVVPSAQALAETGTESGKETLVSGRDPHYTDRGFFDIHVCNWPDRPLFFMALFSTTEFGGLQGVSIRTPDGRALGDINLGGFRLVKREGKPDKRVFMTQLEIPAGAQSGWYTATARFSDGVTVNASDYVIIEAMRQADNMQPGPGQEDVPVKAVLSWPAVPGASHYQVFISDGWEGGTIYRSKLLDSSRLEVPEGILQEGGWYKWFVHARDVNENILLGDFNHGSLSPTQDFYTTGF